MNLENFVALVVAAVIGLFVLYCLFWPEDL